MQSSREYVACRICGAATSYIAGRASSPQRPKHRSCAPEHGTRARYDAGCRCHECRRAVSERMAAYISQRTESTPDHLQCSDADCRRLRVARGLCHMHYRRDRRADGTYAASPSDAWDDPKRMARYKERKAVTRGARGETQRFTIYDLIKSSGSRCAICAEAIDVTLHYPDAHSPSVDHIIPLSKGGAHTLENARATHLVCNMRRGNREH